MFPVLFGRILPFFLKSLILNHFPIMLKFTDYKSATFFSVCLQFYFSINNSLIDIFVHNTVVFLMEICSYPFASKHVNTLHFLSSLSELIELVILQRQMHYKKGGRGIYYVLMWWRLNTSCIILFDPHSNPVAQVLSFFLEKLNGLPTSKS